MDKIHPLVLHPVILPVAQTEQQLSGRARVAALRRRAREAARLSAEHGGFALGAMEKNGRGVPLPSAGIYWSLSHKEALVAAVVSPRPAGIDIEKIKPVHPGMYERVAEEAEWALAPQRDLALFFRFWTAKEAVLKAAGEGLAALARCRVAQIPDESRLLLYFDQNPWSVLHRWVEPGHLASVTAKEVEIVWHILAEG